MPIEDWKYQVSLALPEGTPDATLSTLYDIVETALKEQDERTCRMLCPFCGNNDYNLIFHHDEWRHYRKTDNHVQYCQTAVIRNEDTNAD